MTGMLVRFWVARGGVVFTVLFSLLRLFGSWLTIVCV